MDAVQRRRPVWRLLHEVIVLGIGWELYTLGRAVAGRKIGGARQHSSDVWALERHLHLPSEARLQHAALQSRTLIHVADVFYANEHFYVAGAVVVWLLLRHPDSYLWFRRVLGTLTLLGLVGHLVYPLAPPRMRPDFGIVDTGVLFGGSVYGADPKNHGLLNQYAAMPSLHVGWALLFAITVVVVSRRRIRWLALLDPVANFAVVVITGNHYWLDGFVGAGLVVVALVIVSRLIKPEEGRTRLWLTRARPGSSSARPTSTSPSPARGRRSGAGRPSPS